MPAFLLYVVGRCENCLGLLIYGHKNGLIRPKAWNAINLPCPYCLKAPQAKIEGGGVVSLGIFSTGLMGAQYEGNAAKFPTEKKSVGNFV